jgi:hypothetical protein
MGESRHREPASRAQAVPIERDTEKYRRLAIAVLEQAWADLYTPAIDGDNVRERAQVWFKSEDSSRPFAFMSLCELLGFNPESVRERVFRAPRLGHGGAR